MITCKEDLIGFYALRSDKEVFELFMDKCEKFGITWGTKDNVRNFKEGEAVTFGHYLRAAGFLGFSSEAKLINSGLVKLTLSDFKPARTEYVKVTGSIFKLKAELEAGKLYHEILGSSGLVVIDDESVLIYELQNENVYRKREVKWQDEVEEYLLTCNAGCGMFDIQYGNGNQLALADEDFLEAARIALKVLGELKC